jgi:beta-phosphoglucomutase family hydrolase
MVSRFGLPDGVRAALFDLDGVITRTASLHSRAWKLMFDEYLHEYAERSGAPFVEFDSHSDYAAYVDGRPRLDGTRTFLASRGITVPEGTPDDPPSAHTVAGLGNRKNAILQKLIDQGGVEVFDGTVRYVEAIRDAGLHTAVVSSSANALAMLRVTGLEKHFDVRIDGVIARQRRLPGKPAPDTFLAAAAELGVPPRAAAVFEDALAGVAAGRAGGFARVVGVDRIGQADALQAHGADIVVKDLEELLGPAKMA